MIRTNKTNKTKRGGRHSQPHTKTPSPKKTWRTRPREFSPSPSLPPDSLRISLPDFGALFVNEIYKPSPPRREAVRDRKKGKQNQWIVTPLTDENLIEFMNIYNDSSDLDVFEADVLHYLHEYDKRDHDIYGSYMTALFTTSGQRQRRQRLYRKIEPLFILP